MTDIYLDFLTTDSSFEIRMQTESGDIKTDDGLKAAVIYSLFTDRLADADDVIPDGGSNRRGHWGDAFLSNQADSEGSKLWLLSREKQTTETLNRAVSYARESLQWLIDDGVAGDVSVTGEWYRLGVLALHIVIDVINGQNFSDTFEVAINGI